MWLILAFLSALFAALVAILGKLGLKGVDSTLATSLRSLIMTGVLLPTAFFFGKLTKSSVASLSVKDWWLLIGAGLAGALSWLCYFAALKLGKAGSVAAIDRLSIVLVIVFAALFLGENLNFKSVTGAILISVGAILLIIK